MAGTSEKARVGLFVTCLVDLFRPVVAFAAIKLLEDAGFGVDVPKSQTCCGQPAYNSGDVKNARALARQVIDVFADYDHVVVPSASCAAMLSCHYPALMAEDSAYGEPARQLAAKTRELTAFLHEHGLATLSAGGAPALDGPVAYMDSCSALRELGVCDQPRELLRRLSDLRPCDVEDAQTCCGFGGLFCVKYPEISAEMATRKTAALMASGARLVVGVELGCLMHVAGRLHRQGHGPEVRHVAEVLAGMSERPAIGAAGPRPTRSRP